MPEPLKVAFLGCGFLTRVHSRILRSVRGEFRCSYASRDAAKAARFRAEFEGYKSYDGYDAALGDPEIDAVIIAVPPKFHKDLTLRALAAGKHVLVEKPAFPTLSDYSEVVAAREAGLSF